MIEEIKSLLSQIAKAKAAAIVIVTLIVGAVIYTNFNFVEGISLNLHLNSNGSSDTNSAPHSQPSKNDTNKQKQTNNAYLRIKDVRTTPVRFQGINYLYFRLESGTSNKATNVVITIDLGTAAANTREIRQKNLCSFEGEINTSVQIIKCQTLPKSEYVDIMLTLTEPTFSNIKAYADNTSYTETVSFENNTNNGQSDKSPGFISFLIFLSGFVVFILTMAVLLKILGHMFKDSL